MADTILEVADIDAFYARSQVLHGISLGVPRRGCVAIIGRNGAGKTTLLQTIAGEHRQKQGTIRYDGVDITQLPTERRIRAGIGYVPQDINLFSGLTVLENLRLGATGRKDFSDQLAKVVGLFPRIGQRLGQKAGTLSGGERKMVAISRALVGDPKLLMLDEPTEGVWHGVIDEIAVRLKELSRSIAVLIVEQHLNLAFDVASHCYVVDRGHIALEGESAVVRADARLDALLAP